MSVTIVDKINTAVASSPVGTWFRLEGCGHPKERSGSRFSVSHDEVLAMVAILNLLDRNPCRPHNLGTSPSDFHSSILELKYVAVGRDGIHCQRLPSTVPR